jgi:SepF-like predicted cell division protein (DUF552 family)
MNKKLIVSLVLILSVPFCFLANGFQACCDDHADTVKAYLDSVKDLVARVKAENLEQFFQKSHRQEGLTYLKFVSQSSLEAVQHYNEMILKSDPAIKNLEEFKQSQKVVESLQKKAQQLAGQIKAARDDRGAKILIEKIALELK